jgi:hypothetical protein
MQHGGTPLFVNLRGNSDPLFRKPQMVQLEGACGPMLLPAIVDGVIWIPRVHPPHYPMRWLLVFSLWHVRWFLCDAVILIILLALVFWRLRSKKRQTRHTATP